MQDLGIDLIFCSSKSSAHPSNFLPQLKPQAKGIQRTGGQKKGEEGVEGGLEKMVETLAKIEFFIKCGW